MDVIVYLKYGAIRGGWIASLVDVGYDMIENYNNNIVNAVGTWPNNPDEIAEFCVISRQSSIFPFIFFDMKEKLVFCQ